MKSWFSCVHNNNHNNKNIVCIPVLLFFSRLLIIIFLLIKGGKLARRKKTCALPNSPNPSSNNHHHFFTTTWFSGGVLNVKFNQQSAEKEGKTPGRPTISFVHHCTLKTCSAVWLFLLLRSYIVALFQYQFCFVFRRFQAGFWPTCCVALLFNVWHLRQASKHFKSYKLQFSGRDAIIQGRVSQH